MSSTESYDSDIYRLVSSRLVVFWDFDGVIKDSVNVKTNAFEYLFRSHAPEVRARVKAHHEANGGISRYEKIPIYLSWAGLPCDRAQVDQFCSRFSEMVLDAVVESPWVPGVEDYLLAHYELQYFVLVTATPRQEIETILKRLRIAHCFREVYGAPTEKKEAIANVLRAKKVDLAEVLMIGDTEADMSAAEENQIPFLLRRTRMNLALQSSCASPQFEDLL